MPYPFHPSFSVLLVSTLDCLYLITLSIISDVYCHSHFICPLLSFSVSTLDWLFLITLSIISDFYCHSHFIRPFLSLFVSTLDCLFLIALSIFSNVYFHSHFIPLFCLRSCQLWIVYALLHFRLSLTFIAIAISSPFLSSFVSTLDCLFLVALSIFSNVYCHSHFIPPFLSSLESTLDCLFLITLSIISDVYCHNHFIPPLFVFVRVNS